jgi:membrane associated rhomboid family serine protease
MNQYQYRPSGFGWLTPVIKNLLILNALFFIARIAFRNAYGADLADLFGLRFPTADNFHFYQIITYMFLHGDFWHLFFNMFALWMFGKPIEERFGTKRFLIYYFVTGIGAAVIHYGVIWLHDLPGMFRYVDAFLANPDLYTLADVIEGTPNVFNNPTKLLAEIRMAEQDPLAAQIIVNQSIEALQALKINTINSFNVIGASGAVFGILLAFGMMFPNTLIYIYFAIPIKAKYFVMIYGALELFQGVRGGGSNIAHLAHVGGMLFGFILIKLWNRKINRPTHY